MNQRPRVVKRYNLRWTTAKNIYESSTQSGKEVQGKMDNSQEYLRKQLSQKHEEFQKDLEGFE